MGLRWSPAESLKRQNAQHSPSGVLSGHLLRQDCYMSAALMNLAPAGFDLGRVPVLQNEGLWVLLDITLQP